jgi:dihydrofolate reductase
MSKSVLYMSMSLDGFITGPEDDEDHPLGIDGDRLHDWLASGGEGVEGFRPSGPSGEVFDEMMATGAVIAGRRTFDLVRGWNGDHHGVPIFVPTHRVPDDAPPGPITFVTEGIEATVAQAKAAAGDRDVMVHGAETAQHCLRAGVLDEMEIQLIPVLLGEGRPLFAQLGAHHIELTLTRVLDAPGVTHLRYEVGSVAAGAGDAEPAPGS